MKGSLILNRCPIRHLPQKLTVDVSLSIEGSRVTEIGDGVVIGCSLLAARSMLMHLPSSFVCKGGLYLEGTLVECLPEREFFVGGDLVISSTDISTLPAKGCVEGGLYARNTRIRTVPTGFTVRMFANFNDGKLEVVPEHWALRDYISFSGCPVRSLGSNADKLGAIYANDSALCSLPEGLVLSDNLCIEGCPIEYLPKKLIVMGDLLARNSGLKALTDHLVVGGKLDVSRTDVMQIPASVVARSVKMSVACDVPPLWVGEHPMMHVSGEYLVANEGIWRIEERKGEAYRCTSLNGRVTTWIRWENGEWRYGKEFDGLER